MAKSRILIVEDEGIVALDIKDRLEEAGYEVTGMAASGTDAINKAKAIPPDLILMDIMILGEMDGIQTAQEILKEREVPVIFLTAYSDERTVQRAKMSGPYGYIIKPFEDRDLEVSIDMALYRFGMERKLKESEQWLTTTLKSINDAVVATDQFGLIRFFNPAAETLLGATEADVKGRNVREVLNLITESSCRPAEDPVEIVLNKGNIPSGDHCLFVSRDGLKIPIEDSGSPIVDERENVQGAVLVFRDISERKEAESQQERLQKKLKQTEKMQSLAVLAGGVAHDLNNLLGPLVAYPDLLISNLSAESFVRDKLERMKRVAQQAAGIIQDLLTMARRGRYEMESINLNELVQEYLMAPYHEQFMSLHPQVQVKANLNPAIGSICGSQVHLSKSLMNLVVNALEAMPEGGDLEISTSQEYIKQLRGGFNRITPGEYVILTVKDSGIGIDKDNLEKIFEPYYSHKKMGRSGSGLGLAVVYGVVSDHCGYYDVFSTVGKGTEFVLYFPLGKCEKQKEQTKESVQIRGSEKVLIVDDDPEQRQLAVAIMKSFGYQTESVTNGHEAIEYLNKSSADIIVLDMIMEEGFDGLNTYQEILKTNPGQKAIVVSGFSATDRVRLMQELGAGAYVKKPYDLYDLGRAVRNELDKRPAGVVQ